MAVHIGSYHRGPSSRLGKPVSANDVSEHERRLAEFERRRQLAGAKRVLFEEMSASAVAAERARQQRASTAIQRQNLKSSRISALHEYEQIKQARPSVLNRVSSMVDLYSKVTSLGARNSVDKAYKTEKDIVNNITKKALAGKELSPVEQTVFDNAYKPNYVIGQEFKGKQAGREMPREQRVANNQVVVRANPKLLRAILGASRARQVQRSVTVDEGDRPVPPGVKIRTVGRKYPIGGAT